MPPSQATLGSIGSPHRWVLADPLLARCVEGARCTDSSSIPLATTRSLARSLNSYAQPRTSEAYAPTHRMPLLQSTLGSVSSRHHWALAYPLLARCVEGARCTGSSTTPLRSQPPARSRAAVVPMRSFEQVRRGHPPYAAIAGHFGLDRLAPPVGACVSVARSLCGGRT
eukprot:6470931-Prymnesium_polylepis.1